MNARFNSIRRAFIALKLFFFLNQSNILTKQLHFPFFVINLLRNLIPDSLSLMATYLGGSAMTYNLHLLLFHHKLPLNKQNISFHLL